MGEPPFLDARLSFLSSDNEFQFSVKKFKPMLENMLQRPITPLMENTLMDCHERELMNLDPMEASSSPSIAGLVRRKMVIVKPFILAGGKVIIAAYITTVGKRYLAGIEC